MFKSIFLQDQNVKAIFFIELLSVKLNIYIKSQFF